MHAPFPQESLAGKRGHIQTLLGAKKNKKTIKHHKSRQESPPHGTLGIHRCIIVAKHLKLALKLGDDVGLVHDAVQKANHFCF
jgi:hypothetical protein